MASKGGQITGFVVLAIFVAMVIIVCLGALALTTYSSCCNIQATTGTNISKRESIFNMIGSLYWGWFVAPTSILIFIGLIVGSYFGCRKLHFKIKDIKGESGNTQPNDSDKTETE